MNPFITIWIDLTGKPSPSENYRKLSGRCDIRYLKEAALIPDLIRKLSPGLICFEFDAPDPDQLQTLRQTKEMYPSLPVLLVTEYHSEEFAVWSLRMRVWDYLVKPVSPEQILDHIRIISCLSKSASRRKIKTENVPISPIPIEVRCSGLKTEGKKECPTYQAVPYIEKYYAEKIRERDVARICGLQSIRFSLLFKKEQGITFQKYLIQFRIHKAAELLNDPSEKVTHAASSVGFNDLSDFARIFKQYMGVTPLKYRQQQKG
ncbi:MAG: DNA-binding response regulator [Nitrospirae bacterium]|nr:DNA-binding response regulator [Nitrospirota bacterium]